MRSDLNSGWRRFKSDVPVWVAKLQILLGSAAGTLGTMAAIAWPGKTAVIGTGCAYGVAGCVAIAAAIQFVERSIKIIEQPVAADKAAVNTAA